MKQRKQPEPARQGFSLIEVMIGMTVLAIAMAGAFYLSVNISRQQQGVQFLASATNLAEYKLEELRNAFFAEIVSGADGGSLDELGQTPGRYARSWEVVDDQPVASLKTVTVTVTWDQFGETQTYTLAGIVSPYLGVVSP